MQIILKRKKFLSDRTIGELTINGKFKCYTLEDTVRPEGVKIPGETAIPAGTYTVTVGAGGPEAGTSAAASKPATVCGGDSSLSGSGLTLMAKGGGWGAAGVSAKNVPTSGYLAAAGGSGGGGANYQTEGAGIEDQGFAGGAPAGAFGAGSGGGGATAVGAVGVVGTNKDLALPSIGGNGGSGVMCTITGEEVYYGGGGGAGVSTFDWYKHFEENFFIMH